MASSIAPSAPYPQQVVPSELAGIFTLIIAEECGCTSSWAHHTQPVTREELRRIALRTTEALRRFVAAAGR